VLGRGEGLVVPAHSRTRGYDGPVTALRRRPADPTNPILAIALALLMVACGSTVTPSVPSVPSAGSTAPEPSLTPVPGGSTAASRSPITVTQTNTDTQVGRIWDALPNGFPRIANAIVIDNFPSPTSGAFAVGTTVENAVATMRTGLTGLGYNVDVGSPLEDGSIVLDAGGGENPECRIEVQFTPQSGTTRMVVLYGSECPFS
jgi:hypothetical protein